MADTLSLKPAYRNRTKCDYLDYYINGRRLADILDIGDFIPPLGWLSESVGSNFIDMLLLRKGSDLRDGRFPLFVCPECVDYGCGVGTCNITLSEDMVTWSNFGWETDYEEEINQEPIDKELVLRFDKNEYFDLFTGLEFASENKRQQTNS